jgi:hypothetical protein
MTLSSIVSTIDVQKTPSLVHKFDRTDRQRTLVAVPLANLRQPVPPFDRMVLNVKTIPSAPSKSIPLPEVVVTLPVIFPYVKRVTPVLPRRKVLS